MPSLRPLALLAPAFSLAGVLPPSRLAAQAPDSALFRPGQSGVDFRIGSGFAGAGLLHFTSPTRAVLLDLSGGYSHASGNPVPPLTTVRTSNITGTLSIGRRAYHRVDPRVYRWATFGLSFLYNRQRNTQDTVSQVTRGIGAGAFVNLGGAWLVSPHLGLGAQWQVDLQYTHNSGSTPATLDVISAQLGRVALTGQFYF